MHEDEDLPLLLLSDKTIEVLIALSDAESTCTPRRRKLLSIITIGCTVEPLCLEVIECRWEFWSSLNGSGGGSTPSLMRYASSVARATLLLIS